MKSCAFEGCERQGNHREWCATHYHQWWRGVEMRPIQPRPKFRSVNDRFWSKVNKNGPVPDYRPDLGSCWTWLRARDGLGYSKFHHNNKWRPAHVVAYEFIVGLVPDGLELDHLCRNRGCVNPAHLEAVTHQENMRRKARRTHCKRGHPFSDANTYVTPDSRRQCKICMRIRDANRQQAERKAA